MWRMRIGILVAVLVLAGSDSGAARPTPIVGVVPSLAGQLLVAAPELDDPNFSHTIVYMVRHNDDGAVGVVINRVLAHGPLGKLLDKLEAKGWVTRRDDPDDRRARRVYCTSKIEKHLKGIAEAGRAMFAEALADMRADDVKALIERLQQIKRNLGGPDDMNGAPARKSSTRKAP